MPKHTPMPLSSRIGGALLFGLPWLGAILAALPAAALILRGFWGLLFLNWRLSLSHWIVYLLVPALYLFGVWRAFRNPESTASTVLRVLLLWLLGIVVLFFSWLYATALSPFETHGVVREDAVSVFSQSVSRCIRTRSPALRLTPSFTSASAPRRFIMSACGSCSAAIRRRIMRGKRPGWKPTVLFRPIPCGPGAFRTTLCTVTRPSLPWGTMFFIFSTRPGTTAPRPFMNTAACSSPTTEHARSPGSCSGKITPTGSVRTLPIF